MNVKRKWERTKTGARLVESQVLGSTRKLKRGGSSYKRADGRKGKAPTEKQARAKVERSVGAYTADLASEAADRATLARIAQTPVRLPRGSKKTTKKTRKRKPVAASSATARAESPGHFPALTAANLRREAQELPASARFHGAVFLGPLLARFGTTPQAAAAQLMRLYQGDEITLSRADLVDAMDPELVRSSEIEKSGARFHLFRPE
jgi:hypothetical protein